MNKKLIPGFDDYYATPEGIITHENKIMTIQMTKKGMPFTALRKNGQYRIYSIAKLVAMTFLSETHKTPSDVVCYKDGNNHNFHVDNLYWSSRSEAYSKMYSKDSRYSQDRLYKLKKALCKPVLAITKDEDGNETVAKKYESISEASKDVGVSPASISRCLKSPTFMSAGFYWYRDVKEDY